MPNTTDATGNNGSKPNSILGSKHTMSNITGNILITLGTVPVLLTTTTPKFPTTTTTTPVGCLLPADTTTHSNTSNSPVTDPRFELVSEPIKVNPTSVNHGPDVIVPSKTTTASNAKKKEIIKEEGKKRRTILWRKEKFEKKIT